MVIPQNGYIYIYVANESPTNVYFDNLQIIHEKSNVLELSDYYPYGLRNESLSYTGLSFYPANNYHYQDKELQTSLGLNMHEFGLRHYDATLGRWGVQDPFMQYYNPYLAMGNNPVSIIDPTGGIGFQTQGNPKRATIDDPEYGRSISGGGKGGFLDGLWMSGTQLELAMGNDGFKDPENINYTNSYFGAITEIYYLVRDENGNSRGLFANKGEADIVFAGTLARELGLQAYWHGDENNTAYLTNDGKGGAVVHLSIDDADGTCVWSNWNGEYDGSGGNNQSPIDNLELVEHYFMGDKFENLQFQKDIQTGSIDPKIASNSFMKYADYGLVLATGFAPATGLIFKNYPKAGGIGFDFGIIRFDFHKFRLGGKKMGKDYTLPHIDIPGYTKHWPWHQINKWMRGVK